MTTIRKRPDQYSETAIEEEIVVMSLDSGTFFSLTGTARTIWELLDRHPDRSELLTELARAHGADKAAIAPDLDQFVAALGEAGLVDCI